MKAEEGFTLGRLQLGVCGLTHPCPVFLKTPKTHLSKARKDHARKLFCLRQIKEVMGICCMMVHRMWPFVDLR